MNFVEELTWRGMVHTMMPGTEELLAKEQVTAYLGIDPTADSLHIGHLCGVMMLRHFQRNVTPYSGLYPNICPFMTVFPIFNSGACNGLSYSLIPRR